MSETRPPLQKKICLAGAFGAGKTSLVRRFLQGVFDERYLTTVGVKIDKYSLLVDERQIDLVIWDLAGEDFLAPLQISYLRGASGYLLVADATRKETLETAESIVGRIAGTEGALPFVLALNKVDLAGECEVSREDLDRLETAGWRILRTSAKSGEGVTEAFEDLARRLL